jgi:hypothetical protein
LIDFLY